ncbi:MAG: HYR domain-containing protein [Bacteroidia bacterium]|nr:HYR domain-containing protein [Bacteroidia bacterium]
MEKTATLSNTWKKCTLSIKLWMAFTCILVHFSNDLRAQISVTVTNPANTTPNLSATYPSLSSALNALNAVTAMTGPVTLTLGAGTSETAPPNGLTIGSATLNPVLSPVNTVTLIKAGGIVTLNAGIGVATPSSAVPDGILKIAGADYITLNGLTFTDGNLSNPATMEFGLALFKASPSDGAGNNTIQNCSFNMQRVNNDAGTAPMAEGSVAILVINAAPGAATTALTPTTAAGTNSNNRFFNNTIIGGNYGIVLSGFAASSPFTTGDQGNDIGGTGTSTGNFIFNYGGGGSLNQAAAIRANHQWSLNISYNTINNNNGGGVNHGTTLRGIHTETGNGASATINNNSVTVNGGGTTTALIAIDNGLGNAGSSNTIQINNNTISACTYSTATSGTFTGIQNTATAATVNINGNTVSGNSTGGTGLHNMILNTAVLPVLNINSNTISNNLRTASSGTQRGISFGSPSVGTINGNTIELMSFPLTATSVAIDGIYGLSNSVNMTINNNIIRNLSIPSTGIITGIREFGISGNKIIQNNQVFNFTTVSGGTGGSTFIGINCSVGDINISNNLIHSLNSTGSPGGASGGCAGIQITNSTTSVISRNKIYNISSASVTPTVVGIITGGGANTSIFNNLVGDLRTPSANSTHPLAGISISGGSVAHVSYNTIYLNTSSSGLNFGSSGIYASITPTLTLRNNIVINTSAFSGSGLTAAYRRSSGTTGVIPSTYSPASDNNIFFAGIHFIYVEGIGPYTNVQNTMAGYKAFMVSIDQASVTENCVPSFLSTVGSSAGFLHFLPGASTLAESAAFPIPGITDDFDGNARSASSPDIGADEFSGSNPSFVALDMRPFGLLTPSSSSCYGSAEVITAQLKNNGTNALNFAVNNCNVSVTVTGPVSTSFNATINTGTLAPGATMNLLLPGTLNMSAAGTYSFTINTTMAGDLNPSNDNFGPTTRTVNSSVSLPQMVNFNGYNGSNLSTVFPGWREANTAILPTGTTSSWTSSTIIPLSGNTARVNLVNNSKNEWLVGPKFVCGPGTYLGFKIAITDFNFSTPDASGMQGTDDKVIVKISTDCGNTFTDLFTYNAANTATISNTLVPQLINLSAYSGQQVIIAFFATEGVVNDIPDYDFHIDDINIGTICTGTPVAGAISASVPGPFCGTGSTVLTSSGASSDNGIVYQWYSSAVSGSGYTPVPGAILPNYTASGFTSSAFFKLSVKCISSGDSVLSNEIGLLVLPKPTVSVTPDSGGYCGSGSIALAASGAVLYAWSPSTGLSGTTGPNVTASPASNTVYTVTGTDINGCTNTATASVYAFNIPSPLSIAPASPAVCPGSSILLNAVGGTTNDLISGSITFNLTNPAGDEDNGITGTPGFICPGNNQIASFVLPPVPGTYTSARLSINGIMLQGNSFGSEIRLHLSGSGITGTSGCYQGASTGGTPNPVNYLTGVPTLNDTTLLAALLNTAGGTVNIRYSESFNDIITGPDALFPATATLQYTYAAPQPLITWNPGNLSGTSQTVSPAVSTTYSATATSMFGCSTNASTNVMVYPPMTALAAAANASCATCADGSVSISSINGGTPPHTFTNLSGLLPGNYCILVTDANGCTTTACATVQGANCNLLVSTSFTNASCNGAANGSAAAAASGGVFSGPFTYSWSNGSTGANISGLSAGTYTVVVAEPSSGCYAEKSVQIAEPEPIAVNASSTPASCTGTATGSINISVSGGAVPENSVFDFNSGLQGWTTGSLGTSCSGNATASSGWSSQAFGFSGSSFGIPGPNSNVQNSYIESPVLNLPSVIHLNARSWSNNEGGYPCFYDVEYAEYSTDGGISWQPFFNIYQTNLHNGDIASWNMLNYSANIIPSTNGKIRFRYDTGDGCCGSTVNNPGWFIDDVTIANTTTTPATFTFLWSNGSTAQNLSGVTAGTYTLTVTSSNGCSYVSTHTVADPVPLVADASGTGVSCFGGNDGTATVSASGGNLMNYSVGSVAGSLPFQGSVAVAPVPIGTCNCPPGFVAVGFSARAGSFVDQINLECRELLSNGTLGATVVSTCTNGTSGGGIPYGPYLSVGNQALVKATILEPTNPCPNCYPRGMNADSKAISEIAAGSSNNSGLSNIGGFVTFGGSPNTVTAPDGHAIVGMITYTTSGAGWFQGVQFLYAPIIATTQPSSYTWSNGATTSSISGLSPGNYCVTITDANGCTASDCYQVTQSASPLSVICHGSAVTCNGANDGIAAVTANGGSTYQGSPYGEHTFSYTGSVQTFTVPPGVTSINIEAFGAQGASGSPGGNASAGGAGGLGAKVKGSMAVIPGQTFTIHVGGAASGATAGFNGGGTGGNQLAGGGGGASDVRFGGTTAAHRILVAGGGGGGGRGGCEQTVAFGGAGGVGGGGSGANGANAPTSGGVAGGGFGAAGQTGGAAGVGCSGFLGIPGLSATNENGANGGDGQSCCCFNAFSIPGGGGGGGGYLGGGGGGGGSAGTVSCSGNDKGGGGGGAGGTSYLAGILSNTLTANGIHAGNGKVVISYGVQPYTYAWSNGGTTASINGLAPGTYCVTVTDSTGCSETCCYTIFEPAPLTATMTKTDPVCNGDTNGVATAMVTGGLTTDLQVNTPFAGSPLSYGASFGPQVFNLTADVVYLADQSASYLGCSPYTPGNLTGKIALIDRGTCTFVTKVLNAQNAGAIGVIMVQNTTAAPVVMGGANAAITIPSMMISLSDGASLKAALTGLNTVNVTLSSTAYQYTWSNGSTGTNTITGLGATTYSVTISDASGCTTSGSTTLIDPPALLVSTTSSAVTCNGLSNGTATANASGGNPNCDLGATDVINNFFIVSPTISSGQNFVACNTGAITQITVNVNTGTTGQIMLSMAPGTDTSVPTYTQLLNAPTTAGVWVINLTTPFPVTMGNTYSFSLGGPGSTVPASFIGIGFTDPGLSYLSGNAIQNNAQVSTADLYFGIHVAGSVNLPYTFAWSNGATSSGFGSTIGGLPAGSYMVTVTDYYGCSDIEIITVTQPDPVSATVATSGVLCAESPNGTINLTPTGGTAPYSFLWSNGSTLEDQSGLTAGTYTVIITDFSGCTGTVTAMVSCSDNIPPTLIYPPSMANAMFENFESGGLAPGWTAGGLWHVTAACSTGTPPNPTKWAYYGIDGTCTFNNGSTNSGDLTSATVAIPANAANAKLRFRYVYNGEGGFPPSGYDNASARISINSGPFVQIQSLSTSGSNGTWLVAEMDLSGYAGSTVALQWNFNTVDGIANSFLGLQIDSVVVSYSDDCPADIVTTNLPGVCGNNVAWIAPVASDNCAVVITSNKNPGDFFPIGTTVVTYTATDGCGNVRTCSFNVIVNQSGPPILTLSGTANTICAGSSNGGVNLTVTGGAAPYTYAWSNGATTQDLSGVGAGNYTVTVTEANGCSAIYNASINAISPNVNQPAGQVVCENTATTAVSFSGSIPGTSFSWSNNETGIGLAAAGTGNISSFIAQNPGSIPLTATITVTPSTPIVPELLYYKFNGSGPAVPNLASSPPGGAASLMGGLTQGGSGICNGTLIGTGIASNLDYLNTGWAPNLPAGNSWTISFKTSNINGPASTLNYIFGDPSAGSLRCFTNGVAGTGNWILRGPFNDVLVPGAASIAPHTITFVYDQSAGNIKAYVDGILINTVIQSTAISLVGSGPFKVGGYSSNVGLPAGGLMDEFMLFSRALNPAEVQSLAAGCDALNCTGSPTSFTITVNPLTNYYTDGDGDGFGAGAATSACTAPPGTVSNNTDCNDANFAVNPNATEVCNGIDDDCDGLTDEGCTSGASFNLTALIEGYYIGGGNMQSVLLNAGVSANPTLCDTIVVQLRDPLSPSTVVASDKVVMGVNGQATFSFPASVVGNSYYIAVLHRNAIQTWSALPVTFTLTTSYNFTTSPAQAYGANMIAVSPGIYAFYSGDLSPQDEVVDILDQSVMDNDIFNFLSGYVVTDLTGDGIVDIIDQSIIDNNIFNFIGSIHP